MPQSKRVWRLVAALVAVTACGGSPDQQRLTATRAASTPHAMPTQTPLSGGNASFDPDQLFPEYQFTRTDRFWVQLDHRNQPGVTMVIGLDPQNINPDLDEIMREHQRQYETPRSDHRPESGSMESSVLGRVLWSSVSIEGEESEIFEIALYALQPRDQTLIVARSEFPSETADTQAKLNELVAATEAVAPGL